MKNLIPFLIIILLGVACNDEQSPTVNPNIEEQGDLSDLTKSNLQFSFDLFKEVESSADENANVLISPLSIEIALYMLLNGADNNTLEEIRSAMNLDQFYPNGINARYPELLAILESNDPSLNLNISNAMFWDPIGINVEENYKDIIANNYHGSLFELDFNNVEQSLQLINNWADNTTNGRIKEVLTDISADEVLFLLNALYFIGDWKFGFAEESTQDMTFTLSNGNEIQTPIMFTDNVFKSIVNEVYSAVELDFKGEEYSMTFVMPNENNINDYINETLNSDFKSLYDQINTDLEEQRIFLNLPKFEVKNKIQLKEILKTLGINEAFSSTADLSKMGTSGGNLFVTRVIHDAFLKIDEKGAEGAAVTTIGVGVTSLPPVVSFDKPFLYWIKHKETDTMVFMGKMENPHE